MARKLLFGLIFMFILSSASAGVRHMIVPPSGTDLDILAATPGIKVLERYPGALWVEGSVHSLQTSGMYVKSYPDWNLIRTATPFRVGDRAPIATAADRGLYLVHFGAPMKAEWKAAVAATPGVTVVQTFPNFALVVHVAKTPVDFTRMAGVDWAGPFDPAWRISPHVSKAANKATGTASLMIVNVPGVEETFDRLHDLGVQYQLPSKMSTPWFTLRATGPRSAVEQVAALEHVLWIEPRLPMLKHDEIQGLAVSGQHSGWLPDTPGYKAWLSSVGLDDLSTVIVDVADDGWDTGDMTSGNHHPDFDDSLGASRIDYLIDLCADGAQGGGGHGTINQSIVLGDGAGTGLVDGDGYAYGTGIAPTAHGGHTKIFPDDGSFCPSIMTEITEGAQAAGAQIASNSWGASTYGGYSIDSAEYDLLVRDANNDPNDGLQEFTVIFSAGNDGPTDTQIGAPGTAKNVITSGASENVRDDGQADGCGDNNADSFQDVTDFSSPGPCEDGRIKPDAMAPGNHVQGAASQYSGFAGSSVCGGPDNDFAAPPTDAYWPEGQTWYTWSSGTSHSAPGMAGAAALIYEWYLNETGVAPSPAMNKAIMLASADDMAGGDDGNGSSLNAVPDTRQGWGLVNLGRMADGSSSYFFDQEHVFTSSGQDFSPVPVFAVVDPSKPVRIMMVYTDAPGNPDADPSGGLANDLDLEVTVGADVYLGNNFSSGVSQTGGTADAVNNVEAVYFPAGAVTAFSMRVIAATIAGDALPGDGNAADQDFALYMYNVTDQTADGIVALNSTTFNCSATVEVMVSDENLQGTGTLNVTVESTTETTPETLTLTEDPAGSGVFLGSIGLTTAAVANGDSLVSVAGGDTFTATYEDANTGSGSSETKTATANIDCTGPVISLIDVPAATLTAESAVVTWVTDEEATSVVEYGIAEPLTGMATQAGTRTGHTVSLSSLDSCTPYLFQVTSCDPWGNCTTDNNVGAYHEFTTGMISYQFSDDVEGLTTDWTAEAPWAITDEDASSASHSWTDSPGENYTNDVEASLTSPVIDLSGVSNAELRFMHAYAFESTYDFGYVEVSTDGSTWTQLASYTGSQAGWAPVALDLTSYVGSATFQVRFHISTDVSFTYDGWHVDDIMVTSAGSCSQGSVELDYYVYDCAATVNVTVKDMDLNTDSAIAEEVTVELSSDTEVGPVMVTLTEQTTNSSTFIGSIDLTTAPATADGMLSVTHGDVISATYDDANDGSGSAVSISDSAEVDCESPVISGLTVSNVLYESARVSWTTNELADTTVNWFTTLPPDSGAMFHGGMVTDHAMPMTELNSCTRYTITAQSADPSGHSSLSSTAYFTTWDFEPSVLDALDTPMSVPDNNPTGVMSTISVSATAFVGDVNVLINIDHTFDGDLDIYLVGPDGTTVELSTDNGSSGDDYVDTVFDDEADNPITGGTAPFTGSFIPEGSLSDFDGLTATGDWSLHVIDDAGSDLGTVLSWQLQLTVTAMCPPIFADGFETNDTSEWSGAAR